MADDRDEFESSSSSEDDVSVHPGAIGFTCEVTRQLLDAPDDRQGTMRFELLAGLLSGGKQLAKSAAFRSGARLTMHKAGGFLCQTLQCRVEGTAKQLRQFANIMGNIESE